MEVKRMEHGETHYDTGFIAKKFGMKHADVVRSLVTLIKNNVIIESEVTQIDSEYRGTPFKRYKLTASQSLRLMLQFQTGNVRECVSEFFPQSIELVDKIFQALADFDFDCDMPDRFVYAAKDYSGNVKIGISKDPERRVNEINIGNPDKLELIMVKPAVGERYKDESRLHSICGKNHIRGEWFDNGAIEFLDTQAAALKGE